MSAGTIVHGVIPLNAAALCLDDETVFHVSDGACPRCASEHFALLATWLTERATLQRLAVDLAGVKSPGYFYALADEARHLIASIDAGPLPKMGDHT